MTISNKITIDGRDYKVLAGGYMRGSRPPKTVRRGVLGNTIVSMGPGSAERPVKARLWVPYAPEEYSPFGSLADLEVAVLKPSVSYTDHITNDPGRWGSGTFNITILNMEIAHFYDAPRPEPGYIVEIEWTKVLS
jgi:hypothetical protein